MILIQYDSSHLIQHIESGYFAMAKKDTDYVASSAKGNGIGDG